MQITTYNPIRLASALIKPVPKTVILSFLVSARISFGITLLCFSQQLLAIDNLSKSDHIGTWTSAWTVVPGEEQLLIITEDKSSRFERHFKNGNTQIYQGNHIEYLDDLLIIKYYDNSGQLTFKLVMSGWHAFGKYKLYGTMYMYNDGIMYNAYTVSLERGKQDG